MVADSLARTVTRLVADGPADADLLRRFVVARDEQAFALIVRRHGPMVFGVCRRTLQHQQDAEDAFQAVFLVLARKARAVRPDGLSRWLYGVAVRVANKARARRARRAAVSADLTEIVAPPAALPADWRAILDPALARLPARYRDPILLCDLLGRSRAEAAAELGIAEGTLSSRLARARDKLRVRLARLGAALTLPTLAAGLSDQAAGTVPNSLIESAVAVGTSVAAARELAYGVLRTMFLAKLFKLSALGACMIGLAAGAIVWLPGAGADPATKSQEVPKGTSLAKDAPKGDSDLERIQGTWVVESAKARPVPNLRWEGAKVTWEDIKGRSVSFNGDRVELGLFDGYLQTFRLSPDRQPKRIDFTFRNWSFGAKGITRESDTSCSGIYKFDGDRLQIVIGQEFLPDRPDSFEWSGPRSPFIHLLLRRPTVDERKQQELAVSRGLDGTWVGVAETVNGDVRPAPRGLHLVVKEDRLRLNVPDKDPLLATFVVDLAAHPWHIDLTATEDGGGVKKGMDIPGIFARHGRFLSLALGSVDRPASLASPGMNRAVYVFVDTFRGPPVSPREAVDLFRPIDEPPAVIHETPPKPATGRLRQLQQERVKTLDQQLQLLLERVKDGRSPLSETLDAVRELAEAELQLADTREARIAAVEKMFKQLTSIESQLVKLQEAGIQTNSGVLHARAARLKAEIELEKLKTAK